MEPSTRSWGIISTEEHVIEPTNLWIERLSKNRWGDRIPHIVRDAGGADCWLIDGRKVPLLGSGSAAALMAERTHEPRTWDEVPPAAYQPAERLKAMDADGIERSVLYPSWAGCAGQLLPPSDPSDLVPHSFPASNHA